MLISKANILSYLIVLLNVINVMSQSDKNRDYSIYKFKGLSTGYNYSFDGKDKPHYHLLDLQFNKGFRGGRHGGGYIYGFGTEVALNADQFTIGPKIGGFLFIGGLAVGSELVTYTNFEDWTLRYIFSIGFGSPKGRLTFNPHLILSNENYRPIHKGYINFTYTFILDEKKRAEY